MQRVVIYLAWLTVFSCDSSENESRTASRLSAPNPELLQSAAENLDVAGSFQTRIPLPIPKFHDIEPALALAYDSSNPDGFVGVGWSLEGWSTIERRGAEGGSPRFDATDRIFLDGMELIECGRTTQANASCSAGGSHAPKVESYLRIDMEGSTWTVTSKEGTVSTYEASAVASSRGTTRWDIARVEDRHGNAVKYESWCDSASECYPGSITYGSPLGASSNSKITFLYEERDDVGSAATGEGLTWMTHRLKTIDVWNGGGRMRAYTLAYDVPTDLGASTLRSFAEFDRNATVNPTTGEVSGISLPPRTFGRDGRLATDWSASPPMTGIPIPFGAGPPQTTATWTSSVNATASETKRRSYTADIDGDGHADSVLYDYGATPPFVRVTRSLPGGGYATPVETNWSVIGEALIADANGDGRDDILIVASNATTGNLEVTTGLGRADGALDFGPAVDLGILRLQSLFLVGDVQGDGRGDLIVIERTGLQTSVDTIRVFSRNLAGKFVMRPTPTGLSSRGDVDPDLDPNLAPGLQLPDPVWLTSDINNDGRTDLFRLEAVAGAPGTNAQTLRVRSFISVDAGFEVTATSPGVPWGMASSRRTGDRFHVGDFNGDGRSDVVFTNVYNKLANGHAVTTTSLHTMMGRGDGTFDVYFHDTEMGPMLLSASSEGLPMFNPVAVTWMTGDINGDSATDFVLAVPKAYDMANWPTTVDLVQMVSNKKGKYDTKVREQTNWVLEAELSNCNNGTCKRSLERLWPTMTLADVDGDERADVLYQAPGTGVLQLAVSLSPNNYDNTHRWISTDINGDGLRDMVYPVFVGSALRVYSSIDRGGLRDTVMKDYFAGWSAADTQHWIAADVGSPADGPDGRADLVYVGAGAVSTLLSNGDGTWIEKPTPISVLDRTNDFRPMDVDGDGDNDLVSVVRAASGIRIRTLLSDGAGSFTLVDRSAFDMTDPLGVWEPLTFQPGDVDGDGSTDLVSIVSRGAGVAPQIRTLLAAGGGEWVARVQAPTTTNRCNPTTSIAFGENVAGYLVADTNADGRSDLVRATVPNLFGTNMMPGNLQVVSLLSSGDGGFTAIENWSTVPAVERREASGRWMVGDTNDDGRSDFVQLYAFDTPPFLDDRLNVTTLRTTSSCKFVRERQTDIPFDHRDTLRAGIDDWDADGRDDITYVMMVDAGNSKVNPVVVQVKSYRVSPRLTVLRNGLGQTRQLSYRSTAGAQINLPVGMTMRVVSRAWEDIAPSGQGAGVDVTYEGARWDYTNHQLLGFDKTRATDGSTYVETINESTAACTGNARAIETGAVGNGVLRRERYVYDDNSTKGVLPLRCRAAERYLDELEYGSTPRSSRAVMAYDVYGNLERESDEGLFVDTNKDGTDDETSDNYTTRREFAFNLTDYIVGLPSKRTVEDENGVRLQETTYGYDNQPPSTAPTIGDVTLESSWDSETNRMLDRKAQYDRYGNLTRSEDETGRAQTLVIDSSDPRYTSDVCDAVGCTHTDYDYVLGLPRATTDMNGATTSSSYDGFGRPKRTDFVDGGCIEWRYPDAGDPKRQRVEVYTCTRPNEVFDGAPSPSTQIGYYDGAQRIYLQARGSAFERETRYLGVTTLVAEQTSWHDTGAAGRVERYAYDVGRRRIRLERGDGSIVESRFSLGGEAAIDELGNVRHLKRDVRGRLEEIEESVTIGGKVTTLVTQFRADPLGRQTRVEDTLGHRSSRSWSSLDRVTKVCDPDRGCRTATYYANGLLETQTDAMKQTTRFTYDKVGRVEQRTDPNGQKTIYRYDRDPATQSTRGASIGRLVTVDAPNSSQKLSYTPRGLVNNMQKCVLGRCVESERTYDVAGRIDTTTYPDGTGKLSSASEIVTTTYDAAGRIQRVASPAMVYARRLDYDAEDRLTHEDLGNGVATQRDYHPTRDRIDSISVAFGGTTLFAASYEADPTNRLEKITWKNPSQNTIKIARDELGRLRNVQGSLTLDVEYDELGNITLNSSVGTYEYKDANHVHAVTAAGSETYEYDDNGQMTLGAGREITWDSRGLPTRITTNTDSIELEYDAVGSRIAKSNRSGTTRYFDGLVDIDPNGKSTYHYYAGTRLLASREGNGVRWYHTDHLGSVRLTTDSSGRVIQRYEYDPFGAPSTFDRFGFAGHQGDEETGLVYMMARYYDPVLGRFISADSIVSNPLTSQGLNRYTYAGNAPLDMVDPDGHAEKEYRTTVTDTRPKSARMLKEWMWQMLKEDRSGSDASNAQIYRRGRDLVFYPNGRGYGKRFVYTNVCPSCHYQRSAKAGDSGEEMSKEDADMMGKIIAGFISKISPFTGTGIVVSAYLSRVDFVETDDSEVKTQAVTEKELSAIFETLMEVAIDLDEAASNGNGGPWGNEVTREQLKKNVDAMDALGWEHVAGYPSSTPEKYLEGPEGDTTDSVHIDQTFRRKGGTDEIDIQTVDVRASGRMSSREDRANQRLFAWWAGKIIWLVIPKIVRGD